MANGTARLPGYTIAVGVILIGAFSWLCIFMIQNSLLLGADEQFRWDRLLLIFNSVQGMAAAAVGVLLGTAVQQGKVNTAEAKAAKAEADSKANQAEANKAETARKFLGTLSSPGIQATDPTVASLKAILD